MKNKTGLRRRNGLAVLFRQGVEADESRISGSRVTTAAMVTTLASVELALP